MSFCYFVAAGVFFGRFVAAGVVLGFVWHRWCFLCFVAASAFCICFVAAGIFLASRLEAEFRRVAAFPPPVRPNAALIRWLIVEKDVQPPMMMDGGWW